MIRCRDMHVQAIEICLKDSSWEPGVNTVEYAGHAKFIQNIYNDHPYYSIILNQYGSIADSYLEIVRSNGYLKDL